MKSQTSSNCPVNHCNQQKWQKINKRGNNRSRRNQTQPCLVFTVTPNCPQQQRDTTYKQAYNNMEISNLDKLFHPDINTWTWNIQSFPGFFCASCILENQSEDRALELPSHHTDKHATHIGTHRRVLIEDIHCHHCQRLLWHLSLLVVFRFQGIQGQTISVQ